MQQPDQDGAEWEQQDILDREQAYIRHEAAKVAEMVARCGGHPERAQDVERGLLEVAGLTKFELAA